MTTQSQPAGLASAAFLTPWDGADSDCPGCAAQPNEQTVSRMIRDGAFDRMDLTCQCCGLEYSLWDERD